MAKKKTKEYCCEWQKRYEDSPLHNKGCVKTDEIAKDPYRNLCIIYKEILCVESTYGTGDEEVFEALKERIKERIKNLLSDKDLSAIYNIDWS